MWIADNWKDYEVLDTSSGEKLERWGKYILVRPDPQVIWNTPHDAPGWKKKNAHYHRSNKGGGQWEFIDLPEQWDITYDVKSLENSTLGGELCFHLKPFQFKHTGLFPEQAVNWEWMADRIVRSEKKEFRVLNLFAYTGGASVACAKAGAAVTHVDAAKGMVTWAKENAHASGLADAPVRYLVDDCVKFVEREIRRENHYDGIVMDPPSYGRGPKGEIWKIEDRVYSLICLCAKLMKHDSSFFLINSYTTGLQPGVLKTMLDTAITPIFGGKTEADEIGLAITGQSVPEGEYVRSVALPCGASGRWFKD